MLIGLAFTTQAQDISKNALGLRLGNNSGFGGEISYQKALSSNNRLELDLGWRNSQSIDAAKLIGVYQWVWEIQNNFNWYAGPGVGIGHWNYNGPGSSDPDGGTFLVATGDIGIEYKFDIPIQISFDLRPEIYLGDSRKDYGDNNNNYNYHSFAPDFGISVRYTF